ncbi:hypothetical protein DSO57_1011042 [Entomophthora muscae]|uniref:Uncharacterized protein n=1 Tax=Entomophthora muscae TaxID=34485 RepID=A0ACC2RXL0_9FUNG|nr:hypothetical protein DSO57_1011042 [Entomophthora muscae]
MPVPASTPPSPTGALRYSWYPDLIIIHPKLSNLGPKMLLALGATYAPESKDPTAVNSSQVQNIIVNQSTFNVVMPYMDNVVNCTINAILIWLSNNDMCEDLVGFAFNFGNSSPSANGSGSISTNSGMSYLPLTDPDMTSSQRDPFGHSVYLMSDHRPLSTI